MASFLVFQLKAPMASFGASIGLRRGTALRPTRSAVFGLLAAALGIRREDFKAYQQLDANLALAHLELATPSVMVDFHTIQLPTSLNGLTRREQMAAGELNCEPSEREYLQNGHWLIALQGDAALLERCHAALDAPVFTLYAGRKSCPLSSCPAPMQLQADTVEAAMRAWFDVQSNLARQHSLGAVPTLGGKPLLWDGQASVEAQPRIRHTRHDRRLSLTQQRFGANFEHEGVFASA